MQHNNFTPPPAPVITYSSCEYSLSKSARHRRTSSGVSTDLSPPSPFAGGGHDADDAGGEGGARGPIRPPLVFCGASGTTLEGTSQIPRLWSSQKRCRSCVWGDGGRGGGGGYAVRGGAADPGLI